MSVTAIIDYGAGNLHSVKNALDYIGEKNIITNDKETILCADKVILPGVGAFGDSMAALSERGLNKTVLEVVSQNKPLLGICLGLQLMFEESEESPGVEGLGIFKGKIVRIPKTGGLKIPHIGWNDIIVKKSAILKGLGDRPYVYFVHSYYMHAEDESDVSAYTDYGVRLAVAAERDNVFATQFHPEKSGDVGMKILKNFTAL